MSTKLHWTVDDVMAETPCLDRTTILDHFDGHESLTLQGILLLPKLSDEHKVWMACRKGALSVPVYLAWQSVVLTRIITAYALPEPTTAVWAQTWLDGGKSPAAAAEAAGTAWAVGTAWAAGAAEAAGAAGTAWAAWAAWAAGAAEFHTQVLELRTLLEDVCSCEEEDS